MDNFTTFQIPADFDMGEEGEVDMDDDDDDILNMLDRHGPPRSASGGASSSSAAGSREALGSGVGLPVARGAQPDPADEDDDILDMLDRGPADEAPRAPRRPHVAAYAQRSDALLQHARDRKKLKRT